MIDLSRMRRGVVILFAILALFGAGSAVDMFAASPAYAQGSAAQPDTTQQPWYSVIYDKISNGLVATPENTQAVFNNNYTMLKEAGCWGCTVFDSFSAQTFKAGATLSRGKLMNQLASVIVAVASLFSLIYIGGAFVSGDAGDLLGRWKVFWQLLIAVAISTAWLTTGSNAFGNTWNVIYGPLMNIPMGIADAVEVSPNVTGECAAGTTPADMPSGAAKPMASMRSVVCGGHLISVKGIAYGLAIAGSGSGIIGTCLNFVGGVAVTIVFLWIAISFPLRFIDVLLRLTVVGIVTPVLIVCAAFKPTRSYVSIGISNVLYAGCLFAFTSIMFKLGSGFFDEIAQKRMTDISAWNPATNASQTVLLVGAAIIFASMLRMAPSLAAEFSQFRGQSGGVGDAATGFASSVATLPVKAGTAVIAAKTGGAIAGKAAGGAMAKGGVGASLGKAVSTE